MGNLTKLRPLVLLAAVTGCADPPLEPLRHDSAEAQFHAGNQASSCPLAPVPPSANVLFCFTTTLQPGVWHGWIIELSDAQPPGTGNGLDFFDRNRLNHPYILASPAGYTYWGPSDPLAPLPQTGDVYTFQPEFNGFVWYDVLRLHTAANGGPQIVPVVVFWVDASGMADDLRMAVNDLLTAGVVNGGQANALTRKIAQAMNLLARGNNAGAVDVLQGFVQQVHNFAAAQVLTDTQAEQLTAWAQLMIAAA
jgi:hypothetical protein